MLVVKIKHGPEETRNSRFEWHGANERSAGRPVRTGRSRWH